MALNDDRWLCFASVSSRISFYFSMFQLYVIVYEALHMLTLIAKLRLTHYSLVSV